MTSRADPVGMAATKVFMDDRQIGMVLWDVVVDSGVGMGSAVGMRAGGIRVWNYRIYVWHILKASL